MALCFACVGISIQEYLWSVGRTCSISVYIQRSGPSILGQIVSTLRSHQGLALSRLPNDELEAYRKAWWWSSGVPKLWTWPYSIDCQGKFHLNVYRIESRQCIDVQAPAAVGGFTMGFWGYTRNAVGFLCSPPAFVIMSHNVRYL